MKKSLIAVALAAAAFATAQVDVNKTVVVVNGEEIKGAEYYHRMEYLTGVGKPTSKGVAEFPPGFLTIEQLITERLILQLAKNKGVYPSDPEVDKELEAKLVENPTLQADWINTGGTMEELRYQTRVDLAQFKIATMGINVTDQQVEAHYKQNGRMYTLAKKVKLSVIVVRNDDTAKKVDADLKAKKPFADVAKAYSEDVTRGVGGEMGNISVPMLSKEVQAAISSIKIGETTAWMSTGDAQVKFLLRDVTPEKKLELDAKLKRQIRRMLMLDGGRMKGIDVQKEMYDLRSKASIDIKDKVFAEAYTRFMEAYKKDKALSGGG